MLKHQKGVRTAKMSNLPEYVQTRKVTAYICVHPAHKPQGFLSIQEIRKHIQDAHTDANSTDWSKKVEQA